MLNMSQQLSETQLARIKQDRCPDCGVRKPYPMTNENCHLGVIYCCRNCKTQWTAYNPQTKNPHIFEKKE